MNFARFSKRLATVGVAGALASAGLVGATSTSAPAATASTTYSCALITGETPVSVTVDSPYLLSSAAAGLTTPFPLPLQLSVTLPENLVTGLRGIGVTKVDASSDDVQLSIVKQGATTPAVQIPLQDVVMPATDVPASGTMTLATPPVGSISPVNATADVFNVPAAGKYDVNMPQSFHFTAHDQNGGTLADNAVCTLGTGAEDRITELTVTKNASTVKAVPVKSTLHKGTVAKMSVTVTAPNHTPRGTVVVKEGRKVLGRASLSKLGKAVVKMGMLKLGKHTVTVNYGGDAYTKAAPKKTVTFRIVR